MNFKEKSKYIRRSQDGFTIIDIMAILVVMAILMAVILSLFASKRKTNEDAKPEPVPAEPIDFPVAESFAVLMVVVAIAGLAYGTFFLVGHFKKKKHAQAVNAAGWEKLMTRYNSIITRWSEYEMDILKIVDYPMMTDMSAPTTIAFHQAMRHARMTEPKNKTLENYLESPFATAVTDLEKAFETAEATAKRSQWKMYDREEKNRLSRAKDMLALALDAGATPHERQIAYRGAMKILNGLINVPPVTLSAIENKTKLALVA